MKLRSYQQQAIDDTRAAIRDGAHAPLLVLPTGGGKTIIFSAIASAAAAKGKRVLILVHRRELIHQASSKLAWVGLDHGIIAAGIPATNAPVQIASVQTLARRLHRINWQPGLIIIDEAHHATAGQWERILQHWPDTYRLGVTATPCRLDGRGLGAAFDAMVLGPSVADLISAGFLSPARIYAPPVVADLASVRTRAGDYANDQAAAAMDRPTVTGDAISHYQRLASGQQAIAFCCNVKHAVSVCDAFKTAGIAAELLLGDTQDREQVVADFAAHRTKVLVTVDVVSEGFDVPAASCAILLRPTQSLGLYLQQVGRVLRPAPDKPHALILDHVGNVNRHGFPDDPHDWSLDDRMRRTKGTPAPSVRTCPKCFAAFKPQPQCPACGAQCVPIKSRVIREIAGELQELVRDSNGVELRGGERVRVAAYPGRYFFFGGTVGNLGDDLVQVFKRRSDMPIGRTLNSEELMALQKQNNDPLCVFNVFRSMVQRGGGSAGINATARRQQGQARTLEQLLALAKERGYSPGWAYRIHQARGKR
jgi:DNA repair protein RadD